MTRVPEDGKSSPETYVKGIAAGEIQVLSRAITLLESTLTEHGKLARKILEGCLPLSGKSVRVGVTGIPGVGKSSFIESLGLYVARECGRKVAVLAIDPTSVETGGSVLGDKIRMNELARHENAYIRPSPSSGSLGGVSRMTSETVTLCEAAGFDTILIETVGVGQSEIACRSMVDFLALLMITGAGDDIQGIKRGITEIADAVVVTKADGDNRKKAELAKEQVENTLSLLRRPESGWGPKVYLSSSLTGDGTKEIWEGVTEYEKFCRKSGYFEENRKRQSTHRMREALARKLENSFYESGPVRKTLENTEKKVSEGKMDPYAAAEHLLGVYFENLRRPEPEGE